MGIALVKIKVMPESPASNLKQIEEKVHSEITKEGGKGVRVSEEPIAFGLKAVFVSFEWPEEKELFLTGDVRNNKFFNNSELIVDKIEEVNLDSLIQELEKKS